MGDMGAVGEKKHARRREEMRRGEPGEPCADDGDGGARGGCRGARERADDEYVVHPLDER